MSFTVKTTMNIVLEEYPAEGYPPMILPWEKRLTDDHTTARIGGGIVPGNATLEKIEFPGIVTVTTLWFYPEAEMSILLGANNAQPVVVAAGGCFGFSHASLPADGALRITYAGAEPAGYYVIWAGD